MSARSKIVIAAIGLLAGGAAAAWLLLQGEDVDRATVGDALARFHQHGGETGEDTGGAPPGVYRYGTRGSEHVDAGGLLTATHDYDGVSTVVVTRGPCGTRERWEVLSTRWLETESCLPPDESGLRAISEFHEFFGTVSEDRYRCHGKRPPRRLLSRIGTGFTRTCGGAHGTATGASRVVAATVVTVAGEPVDAIRTTTRVSLGGDVSGATLRDDWRRRSDGLLLRRVADTEAKRSGAIDADYSEHYSLRLLSQKPRR